jgi:hypothetical protein
MQQRNKTQLITNYLDNNIGSEVTPQQIADSVSATIQTVYNYIRSNPQRFTKIQRGVFKIESNPNSMFLNSDVTI